MVGLDWILLGLRILATLIIYTFLGIAVYIIWRELKQAERQNRTSPEMIDQLCVLSSVEDPALVAGRSLPLQVVTLIGRDIANTITVNDQAVSNHHARLSWNNGFWWLEDLGSRNGTILNDLALSKPASLTDGDIIGIGNVRFRLEAAAFRQLDRPSRQLFEDCSEK